MGFSIDIRLSLILLDPGWIVCLSLVWFAGLRGEGKEERKRERVERGKCEGFKTKNKRETDRMLIFI